MYVCIYIKTYIHTHTYAYMHMHTHTHIIYIVYTHTQHTHTHTEHCVCIEFSLITEECVKKLAQQPVSTEMFWRQYFQFRRLTFEADKTVCGFITAISCLLYVCFYTLSLYIMYILKVINFITLLVHSRIVLCWDEFQVLFKSDRSLCSDCQPIGTELVSKRDVAR